MLEVAQILVSRDNFTYFLINPIQKKALVIDPTEAEPVIRFLEERKLHLDLICNTHHHHDHVGGNLTLVEYFKCPVYASWIDQARIPGCSRGLHDQEKFFFAETQIQTLHTPGHTLGAICYWLPSQNWVFTGDTLFTLGCGRLFEGTAEMLYQSLQRIKALPPETLLFSGHEYGAQNLAFALSLGSSPELQQHGQKILKSGSWSSPTRLADEVRWNPFLTARNLFELASRRKLIDDFSGRIPAPKV